MGRPVDLHALLDFTRASRGDESSIDLARGDTEYHLRGRGQARPHSVSLRWSERLVELLEALRAHTDGAVAEQAARLGRILADFVDATAWTSVAPHLAERGGDEPAFVTLRSNASELYLLPWELVTVGGVTHLGSRSKVLFRYEWPDTPTAPRLAGLSQTRRGRVIFAWSAAGGKVDAARHVKVIERAIDASRGVFDDPDRAFDEVKNASCESIRDALERAKAANEPVAVLHLLCHGTEEGGTFGLALCDDDDGHAADVVSPQRLQALLADYAGLVRLVVISACDGGNSGEVGAALGSVAQEIHKAGFAAVIASRLPLSWDGARVFADALYDGLLGRLCSLEEAFLGARAILSRRRSYDWASLQLYARAADGDATYVFNARPYRGLAAFAPEHARFFFGRTREVDELVADLDALCAGGKARLVVASGASGTGKSSLVLGGAIPRWRQGASDGGFAHLTVRPGATPTEALAQVKARVEIVGEVCRRFVVVVDQFEEVFTHHDPAGAQSLMRGLWELATEPDSPVCVVVTLRVDFLARCNELVLDEDGLRFDKVACDPAHQVLVAQMSPEQLVEAIEGPARATGLALEPGVAQEIVRDVEAAPGALPLMSHALYLLWSRRDGPVITRAAYRALGSVHGALDEHAEAQLAALGDDAERAVARRLMVSLVNPGEVGAPDTRRRRSRASLDALFAGERARVERVLGRFEGARLLVTSGEGAAQTVEVAHEALIRSWRTFKVWIDADRARLARVAQLEAWATEWRQRPDAILQGSRLGYAEEVEKEGADDLPLDVRELLRASREARRRELEAAKRSLRLRRALVATALTVVSAFGVVGFTLWQRAERASQRAATKEREARTQARAATEGEVRSRVAELRGRAGVMGQEVENMADAVVLWRDATRRLGRAPDAVEGALTQMVLTAVLRPRITEGDFVAISGAGARIVTCSGTSASLWDARSGSLVATCAAPEGEEFKCARGNFSLDGAAFAVPSSLGAVRSLSSASRGAATGDACSVMYRLAPELLDTRSTVQWRADVEGRVVSVSNDGAVRVWGRDVQSAEHRLRSRSPFRDFTQWAISPDGTQVAACARAASPLQLWSVAEGSRGVELAGDIGFVGFSEDGRYVIGKPPMIGTGVRDYASVWEVATRTQVPLPARSEPVWISSEHRFMLYTSEDGRSFLQSLVFAGSDPLDLGEKRAVAASVVDGHLALVARSRVGSHHLVTALDGALVREFGGVGAGAFSKAGLTAEGTRMFVVRPDRAELRDTRDGAVLATVREFVAGMVLTRGGRSAVIWSNGEDGPVRIWDFATDVRRATGEGGNVWRLSDRGDRAVLELAQEDVRRSVILDLTSGRSICTFEGQELSHAQFSRDGGRVVAFGDGRVRLFDAETCRPLALPPAPAQTESGAVIDVVESVDGARTLTLHEGGVLRAWDARTGAPGRTWQVSRDFRALTQLSPDGTRILGEVVSGGHALWDVATERRLGVLSAASRLTSHTFSDDGTRLATGHEDGTIALWDARDASLTAVIPAHLGKVTQLSLSRDGTRLASTSEDGSVRLWNLSLPEVIRVGCERLRASSLWASRDDLRVACGAR